MSKVISIANFKGGVGKTTTTASLGVALSRRGKKVLLVDLDAQSNLTSIFMKEPPQHTIFDTMVSNSVLPVIHIYDNMDLVPSSIDMVGIEKALILTIADNIKELQVLRGLLEPIREAYDYILIDCPPSLSLMSKNALVASNGVIVPLTAESLPTMNMRYLMEGIDKTRAGLNKSLELYGILITRYNRRRLNRIVENTLREHFTDYVFNTRIRESVEVMEAPLYRQDIYTYAPGSKGVEDYESLTDEILKLEKHKII